MMEDWRLTDEDIKVAAENGITERLARYRYEQMCWDRERSITQPPRQQNKGWREWKEVALKHGVGQQTFYNRLNSQHNHWTPETAATTPPAKPGDKIMQKKRKISEELVARAEANGITKNTLYSRILNYKWDEEEAATAPIIKGRRKRNNSFNKPIEKRKIQ